jgi:hypothetical protein
MRLTESPRCKTNTLIHMINRCVIPRSGGIRNPGERGSTNPQSAVTRGERITPQVGFSDSRLSFFAVSGDVLGQPLVVAVHKMFAHVF